MIEQELAKTNEKLDRIISIMEITLGKEDKPKATMEAEPQTEAEPTQEPEDADETIPTLKQLQDATLACIRRDLGLKEVIKSELKKRKATLLKDLTDEGRVLFATFLETL